MGFFPKERDLTQPPDRIELVVDGSFFREKAEGFQIRLDQFLGAHFDWRSRNSIQGLVRDGFVYVAEVLKRVAAITVCLGKIGLQGYRLIKD